MSFRDKINTYIPSLTHTSISVVEKISPCKYAAFFGFEKVVALNVPQANAIRILKIPKYQHVMFTGELKLLLQLYLFHTHRRAANSVCINQYDVLLCGAPITATMLNMLKKWMRPMLRHCINRLAHADLFA